MMILQLIVGFGLLKGVSSVGFDFSDHIQYHVKPNCPNVLVAGIDSWSTSGTISFDDADKALYGHYVYVKILGQPTTNSVCEIDLYQCQPATNGASAAATSTTGLPPAATSEASSIIMSTTTGIIDSATSGITNSTTSGITNSTNSSITNSTTTSVMFFTTSGISNSTTTSVNNVATSGVNSLRSAGVVDSSTPSIISSTSSTPIAFGSSTPSINTTNPESNVCFCRSNGNNNYTLHVRQVAQVQHTSKLVEVVMPSVDIFDSTVVSFVIGKLPLIQAISNNVTISIDGDPQMTPASHQIVAVCSNVFTDIQLCAGPIPQLHNMLSIDVHGQTTTNNNSCVHVVERFDFSTGVKSHIVQLAYGDRNEASCPYQRYTLRVNEKTLGCGSDVTPSTSPAPVVTPCSHTATSLPRQPAVLLNGMTVLCDTTTDGGNWVIIQRRTVGDVDFYRNWTDYVTGFGDVTHGGDHWLGLGNIGRLCNQYSKCVLRIDMKYNGTTYYAEYSTFYLGSPSDKFRLHVGGHSGNASDELTASNNDQQFSTPDQDNDAASGISCTQIRHGPWWYRHCGHVNLNGSWGAAYSGGVVWYSVSGWGSLDGVEMKVKVAV